MDKLITVIIPVYNTEKYLRRCIDSVLNQTYRNLEIILVDDGSADGSGKICDEYAAADSRIRVFHKENGGVSSARNYGMDRAGGEYIAFVDSDDYITTGYYSDMYKALSAPDTIVMTGFIEEYADKTVELCPEKGELDKSLFIENFDYYYLEKRVINSACNKLYPTRLVKDVRFDPSVSMGEDLLFNLEVFEGCNSFACTGSMGYHYICTNGSSLTSVFKEGYFEALERCYKGCKAFKYGRAESWRHGDRIDTAFCISFFNVLRSAYHSRGYRAMKRYAECWADNIGFSECIASITDIHSLYSIQLEYFRAGKIRKLALFYLKTRIKIKLKMCLKKIRKG